MYLVVCRFKSSYTGSSSVAKEPHNIKLSQIVMQLEIVFCNPNPLLYPVLIKTEDTSKPLPRCFRQNIPALDYVET
jgi:hypothetical protein